MNKEHFYYCPYCGFCLGEEFDYCWDCETNIIPIKSLQPMDYYYDISSRLYDGSHAKAEKILYEEEIQYNPQFRKRSFESRIAAEQQYNSEKRLDSMIHHMAEEKNKNLPKCPTCSSVNLKRISGLKRGLHGYLFGIFSATSLAQFECKDCGYKW